MCGESWLAVKRLFNPPPHQGWVPGVMLPCCVVFGVVWFGCVMGEGDSFRSFLVTLSGWYAIYNN